MKPSPPRPPSPVSPHPLPGRGGRQEETGRGGGAPLPGRADGRGGRGDGGEGRRWAVLLSLLLLLCVFPLRAADPVIAAAGDIACDPGDLSFNATNGTATHCRMRATSDLLVGRDLAAVITLGDTQYEDGTAAKFLASYDPTWGRVKGVTRPAVGNHDYLTPNAAAYYAYFGAAAGDPAKGYYSFDVGSWHVIVLNSNCAQVGGCGMGSPQMQWLAADLTSHPDRCTLAAWHHPRFSSGPHGNDATFDAFWRALHAAGADVILNGHDHTYERFAPQDPDGNADLGGGIRQFVVGTGGKNLTSFPVIRAHSEVRSNVAFGVLELTLRPTGYDWRFRPAAGSSFTDFGSAACNSAPAPPGTDFHTVTPCRVLDTRTADGPALAAGSDRLFQVSGRCGVPAGAKAAVVNVTAVQPTAAGNLRLYPGDQGTPLTSTVNFRTNRNRANNAIVGLGADGTVGVRCDMATGGTHMVLDVFGYFQ